MSYQLIDYIGEEQGWNDSTKLALALEYIENQSSPEAFRDFLLEKQADDNSHSIDAGDSGPSL
jgi:hypothetical protein